MLKDDVHARRLIEERLHEAQMLIESISEHFKALSPGSHFYSVLEAIHQHLPDEYKNNPDILMLGAISYSSIIEFKYGLELGIPGIFPKFDAFRLNVIDIKGKNTAALHSSTYNFYYSDAQAQCFKDAAFHIVFTNHLLSQPGISIDTLFQEIKRTKKQNGICVMVEQIPANIDEDSFIALILLHAKNAGLDVTINKAVSFKNKIEFYKSIIGESSLEQGITFNKDENTLIIVAA